MKNQFIIIASIFITIVAILFGYFNSDSYYANKLNQAIIAEDVVDVQQIIERKPSCINSLTSALPRPVVILLEKRVVYPFVTACRTGNMQIIELLVEHGADINCNDGRTPLSVTYTVKPKNWYQISLLLIENGASLNYVTEYSGGKVSVLQDIVQLGYEATKLDYIPEKDEEVMAAYYYAIENCDHSQVDWMRALQHSVSNKRIEIVKFLLDEGYCDINDTTPSGMTALMFAARDSTPEMVKLLLDYGATTDYRDEDGKTAYDYAVERDNTDVIPLLES